MDLNQLLSAIVVTRTRLDNHREIERDLDRQLDALLSEITLKYSDRISDTDGEVFLAPLTFIQGDRFIKITTTNVIIKKATGVLMVGQLALEKLETKDNERNYQSKGKRMGRSI